MFQKEKFIINKFKNISCEYVLKVKMVTKCMYCSKEISKDAPIEVCERCGVGVWGPNMFNAIKKNMQQEREKGNIN